MIRIQTLGTVRILRDGEEIEALLRQRLRCALLIYVAMEQETTRELAASVFWPDRAPDRARHALSQTIYELRRALGDDVIRTAGGRLRVVQSLHLDARDFEAAVAANHFERAVALYEGAFLRGFHLAESKEFEFWTDGQTAKLVRLHRRARRGAIEQRMARGRLADALAIARSWATIDPEDDEAQHSLIQLLGVAGNRTAALRQFEQYERLLASDDLKPLDATVELARRLRAGQLESWVPIKESSSRVPPPAQHLSSGAGAPAAIEPPAPRPARSSEPGAGPPATFEERLRRGVQPELEILRPLGRGTTGEVYLAREVALERLVAVKALSPRYASNEIARIRFTREAKSAARISHPNVTTVYHVRALLDGTPIIVMEYIDGRTLAATIDARGPFFGKAARSMLASIASGLAAAHEHGIVHRDVRPANVFVEKRTDRPVLADFGIARLLDTGSAAQARITTDDARLGDVRYMSPEQLQGKPATEQSDIYAFGILAYEVTTGRGPYDGTSTSALVSGHRTGSPNPLDGLGADVDPDLADIVLKCLAKDPYRRPFAADIAALLNGPPAEPLRSPPPSA